MKSEYLNNKYFEQIINKFQTSKRQKDKTKLIIESLEKTIKRRKSKSIKHKEYEDDLLNKKKKYSELEKEFEGSKEHLATAFFTLSENITKYAKFQLIDQDDAIQEGVVICFEKINRFDSRKGKAFNYMTTCILNHFRQLYRTARNYNELKKRFLNYFQYCDNHVMIKNGKQVFISNKDRK